MQLRDDLERYEQLAEKWINGTITPAEKEEYNEWFSQVSGMPVEIPASFADTEEVLENRMIENINRSPIPVVPLYKRTKWMIAAASIVIIAGLAGGYWLQQQKPEAQLASEQVQPEIAPGKTGAVLTLADGAELVLDSLGNGFVAQQNGTRLILSNGQLTYSAAAHSANTSSQLVVYNTLSTAPGRQFNLILPDGTKVWLNASSSLKYPTVFTGTERKVAVTGEVYFEVAKNAGMPFRINVNDRAEIEVLGTIFNVNAYEEEDAIRTTLLEGSVKVKSSRKNDQWSMLKPGQQAVGTNGSSFTIHPAPNIEQAIAWKNGVFDFEDVSLQQAMKQLARWYDIKVVYEKDIPDIEFWGKIKKSNTLNQVLLALESAKVHFRIEDERRLVVLP